MGDGEAEPELEQDQPEAKPKDISGFQYETIIFGLIAGIVILWLLQRRR